MGKSTTGSAFANFRADGRVICQNFNRFKGCTLYECHFAHVCNFRGDWLHHNFVIDTPELAHLHINHKEVLAQIFAALRWAPCWADQHVIIHCDNEAVVHIINNGSTAHPVVMSYLRQLFWLSAVYNFRFTARYIPGKLNVIADSVWRPHKPLKCLAFYGHLCSLVPQQEVDGVHLSNHMSFNSRELLCCRLPGPSDG